MTARRDHRQHVRPRPPSNGRPSPVKTKPRSPEPSRLTAHRSIQRSRGMPLAMRLGLAALVAVLGVAVLTVAAGGVGVVVGGIGSTLGGFITDVTSTPSVQPTIVAVTDAPRIEQPAEPYTNQPTVDLAVIVPQALAGDTDHRVRIYLALEGQNPTAIQEAAIGPTNRVIIPVQ